MSETTDTLARIDVALGNVQGALNTDDDDRFAEAVADLRSATDELTGLSDESVDFDRLAAELDVLDANQSKAQSSAAATSFGFALANVKQALGSAAHEPAVDQAAPSYTPAEVDNSPYPQPEGSQALPVEGDTQAPVADAEAAERKVADPSEDDAEAARA